MNARRYATVVHNNHFYDNLFYIDIMYFQITKHNAKIVVISNNAAAAL